MMQILETTKNNYNVIGLIDIFSNGVNFSRKDIKTLKEFILGLTKNSKLNFIVKGNGFDQREYRYSLYIVKSITPHLCKCSYTTMVNGEEHIISESTIPVEKLISDINYNIQKNIDAIILYENMPEETIEVDLGEDTGDWTEWLDIVEYNKDVVRLSKGECARPYNLTHEEYLNEIKDMQNLIRNVLEDEFIKANT